MNEWMSLATNVAIGSLIGGVTNELAIRMLFRPHRPWTIAGLRVPFTPGLIPRRRGEIAVQMGRLVEQYLLTEEGVRRSLREGRAEQAIREWLTEAYQQWIRREETWREWISRLAPGLFDEDGGWNRGVRESVRRRWLSLVDERLAEAGEKRLRDLVSPELAGALDRLLAPLGERFLERLRTHLRTPEGQAQVQELLGRLLPSGGMLGGLVGMFLSGEKMAAMLLPYLDEALKRPELADRLNGLIRREADALLDMQVRDLIERVGRVQVEDWSGRLFDGLAKAGDRWLDQPVGPTLQRLEPMVRGEWIPRLARWLVETLERHVGRLFQSLAVAEIVARQVEAFPLERVEEMILGITGKEFRMITILGFVLGAVIGLVQGLLQWVT